MPEKKIIAVVGATGAQGGGLVRAILADRSGSFAARAITRNPNSEKAQALRSAGAEVVAGDADDPGTLGRAFAGAHGAFLLTNFWEHFSPERELTQARNMAEAVKAAGVQHVIWSTLEDTRKWVPLNDDRMPTLMGKYKVPHFDAKGEADEIFRRLGVPTTFLLTSFYWDNLIYFGAGPQRGPDGVLAITFPMDDKRLSGIAAEDIGKSASASSSGGGSSSARPSAIAGEHLTGEADGGCAYRRRWGRRCATTTCRPRSTAASASPARTTWATCSSSSATSTTTSSARGTWPSPGR